MTMGERPPIRVTGPGGPHDEVEHVIEVWLRLRQRIHDAGIHHLDAEDRGAWMVAAERIAAREDEYGT